MPVDILNTTTLSEALDDSQDTFNVGSTTNIAAGQLLVVRGEAMKVVEVPSSGRVRVSRGFAGTRAKPHLTAYRVFIGNEQQFQAIKDSMTSLVGDSGVYPDFLLPGQRAKDPDGNEYIMVELTAVTYSGSTVVISQDGNYTAAVVTSSDKGPVGVTLEYGTSDQYVWAQIYGRCAYAQETIGDSAGTSALHALVATTASTPSVGLAATVGTSFSSVAGTASAHILGMFIAGIPTTATTSATSSTGVAYPVWLNYPYFPGFQVRTKNTS